MKILAVDDELLVLRLLRATLPGLGYQDTDFARSGEQALQLLGRAGSPYSCILLDIQMPGMDGIELCQHIRGMPEYRKTPIIMLTAMAEKKFIDESFAAGATDYMNKPIEATELGARLRVAGMISSEQQRSALLATARNAGGNDTDQVDAFDLSDAIRINDVPRVVDAWALENYLLQLDRRGLFGIGMIGFQLRNAARLHASHSPGEFYSILAESAEAISENTRIANSLISYTGNGCFVAVVPRIRLFNRRDLADSIAMTLYQYRLADQLAPVYDIQIDVGPQINGSLFKKRNTTLIDQAIYAVRGKVTDKARMFATRAWALAS